MLFNVHQRVCHSTAAVAAPILCSWHLTCQGKVCAIFIIKEREKEEIESCPRQVRLVRRRGGFVCSFFFSFFNYSFAAVSCLCFSVSFCCCTQQLLFSSIGCLISVSLSLRPGIPFRVCAPSFFLLLLFLLISLIGCCLLPAGNRSSESKAGSTNTDRAFACRLGSILFSESNLWASFLF